MTGRRRNWPPSPERSTGGADIRLRFDFGYVHGIFERADIDLTLPVFTGTPAASTINVRGETGSHVDTVSFSLSYRFGS